MSWQAFTFAGLALVLIGGFAWYERTRPPARLVALVAALAALAVAGRLVLTPIPNVVATTDIALITGYALGGAPGFAVGALAAPISNIWLGQGPWTAWEMAGWGLVGLAGACLAAISGRRLGRVGLACACAFAGLAYGALLDLSVMVSYGGEQSLDRYLALSARGIPFNVAHALGNFAIALAAGPALVRMISRYRTRMTFTWRPAGVLPAALVALAIAGAALGPAGSSRAAAAGSASGDASAWLIRSQNPDGGFAASRGLASSPAMTGWVMLGLEAAGHNPLDVRSAGETPVSYLRSEAHRLRSVNDLERTILALEGAGLDSRRFAGTDLVAELRARRDRDGSVDGQVNLTAFYALALRAAGADAAELARTAQWLREAQNRDGGWGFRPGSPSDPDSSAAALQGLAASGSGGATTTDGIRWLRRVQRGDGGWGLVTSGIVNAQSTAWAVQGLIAAGDRGAAVRDGLAHLARLRAADGHYSYTSSSDQTPVWVTAEVLLAVERQPLPIAAVARAPKPPPSPASGGSDPGSTPSSAPAGGSQPSAETAASDGERGPRSARGPDRHGDDRADRDRERSAYEPAQDGGAASDDPGGPSSEPVAATSASDETAVAEPAAGETNDDGSAAPYVAAAVVLAALAAGYFWHRRRRSPAATSKESQ